MLAGVVLALSWTALNIGGSLIRQTCIIRRYWIRQVCLIHVSLSGSTSRYARMNQEEAAAVLKEKEFESPYWRRRLVQQGAVTAAVLAGILLFRTMNWPRSAASIPASSASASA